MKHRIFIFIFPFLLAASPALCQAKESSLPPVPDTIQEPQGSQLNAQRKAIIHQRDVLNALIKTFNADCASVDENSEASAQCTIQQAEIQAEKRNLADKKSSFVAALKESTPYDPFNELRDAAYEGAGEFYVITPDGRKFSGRDIAKALIERKTKIVTGPDGNVKIKFPDGSVIRMRPNSEFQFAEDPNAREDIITQVTKGYMRLLTGKNKYWKTRTETCAVAVRGTDFEVFVADDNSGYIKLFSGALDLTLTADGRKITMDKGQIVNVSAQGVFSDPAPMIEQDLSAMP